MRKRMGIISAAVLGSICAVLVAIGYEATKEDERPTLASISGRTAVNEVKYFTSLEDMTNASDLIVIGRVSEVRDGRTFGREGLDKVAYIVAVLEVEDVIGGHLDGNTVLIDIFAGSSNEAQPLKDAFVGVSGMWFLTDKHSEALRLGLTGELVDREAGLFMLVNSQGLVVRSGDKAATPLNDDSTSLLYRVTNERPFDQIVRETHSIVR